SSRLACVRSDARIPLASVDRQVPTAGPLGCREQVPPVEELVPQVSTCPQFTVMTGGNKADVKMADCSRCHESFNRFTTDPVFQAPAIVREFLPMPFRRRSGSGNASRQEQPAEPGRWLAVAGKLTVFNDEFDVPAVRCDPGDNQGQGGLGELQKRFAIPVSGDEEFTGDFRSLNFRPPDGLTIADRPPRFEQVGWCQRGKGVAGATAERG